MLGTVRRKQRDIATSQSALTLARRLSICAQGVLNRGWRKLSAVDRLNPRRLEDFAREAIELGFFLCGVHLLERSVKDRPQRAD